MTFMPVCTASVLQENGKAKEDTAKDGSEAQASIGHEDGASALLVVAAVTAASGLRTTKASDWDCVLGGARGRGGRGHGGGQRAVATVRVLSTARVILATGALAGRIVAAVGDAVVSPLLADEEGQGLRVLGDVGRQAVVADALVGEVVSVAAVFLGGHGVDAGLLQTDERALGSVLGAPVIPSRLVDGIGVDGVWVVVLGGGLGSGEASKGSDAEGEDGTHDVGRVGE